MQRQNYEKRTMTWKTKKKLQNWQNLEFGDFVTCKTTAVEGNAQCETPMQQDCFSFLKTSFCAILVDAAAFVAWKGHENNENKFHIIGSFDHNLFPANNLHPRWVKSDKTKNVFRTSHKSNPVLVQSPKWRCQLQAPLQDPAEPEWTGKER